MGIYVCIECSFSTGESDIANNITKCPECGSPVIFIAEPVDILVVSCKDPFILSESVKNYAKWPYSAVSLQGPEMPDELPFKLCSRIDRRYALDIKLQLENKGIGIKLRQYSCPADKSRLKRKNILLIEHNTALRNQLADMLNKVGFNANTGLDGLDALTRLRKEAADMILYSNNSRKHDSLSLLRIIKNNEEYKRIPFIILDAENDYENILKAVRLGVDSYLIKPVSEQALVKKIREVIG